MSEIYSCLCDFFCPLFYDGKSSLALIDGAQFLQTFLSTRRRGFLATLNITTSSVFEVQIFFHSIAMLKTAIQVKALKCSHSYTTETLLSYLWERSQERAWLLQRLLALPCFHSWFLSTFRSIWKKRFVILSRWNQGLATLQQSRLLRHGKNAINNEADVECGV